ncbi:MAG: autotransporter-associated beta strand repeat-containing protein [Planctomycetaceae bacterium]
MGAWMINVWQVQFASDHTITGDAFGFVPYYDENQRILMECVNSDETATIAVDAFSFRPGADSQIDLNRGNLVISSPNIYIDMSSSAYRTLYVRGDNDDRQTVTFAGNVNRGGSGNDPDIRIQRNKRALVTGALNNGQGSDDAVFVEHGVLEFGGSGSMSGGRVVVGDTSGSPDAALLLGAAGSTFSRSIKVRGGSSGRRIVGGANTNGTVTYSGEFVSENSPGDFDVRAAGGGTVNISGQRNLDAGMYVNRPDGGSTFGGTVVLSANTSSSSWTALEAGTLQFGDFAQLGSSHFEFNASSGDSGTLRYTGGSTTTTKTIWIDNSGISRAAIDVSQGGTTLTWNPGEGNVNQNLTKVGAGTLVFGSSRITGGAVVAVEAGTLRLTGSNSYSGGTKVYGGALEFSAADQIGSGYLAFEQDTGDSGTVRYTGGSASITKTLWANRSGQTRAAIDVTQAGTTLTWNQSGGEVSRNLSKAGAGTLVFAGAISGASGNVAVEAGMLRLTGTSSYTGATTVAGGRLAVDGAVGNTSVSVQSGGRLGGAGSIAGAVSVLSGGTLAPGNSIESLSAGATTFAGGSTFGYEYDSTNPASLGSAADLLVVNGNLSIGSGSLITFADLASSPLPFPHDTTIFALINYSGAWNGGLFTYGGTPLPDGGTFTVGTQQWLIDYDRTSSAGLDNFTGDHLPSSTFVAITAVPEPSIYAMAFAGIACGGFSMWRRRRRA